MNGFKVLAVGMAYQDRLLQREWLLSNAGARSFFLSLFYSSLESIAAVQVAVIADRRRSTSDAVVVSQERQLSAVSFGNPFSSVGHHLSAAAPR